MEMCGRREKGVRTHTCPSSVTFPMSMASTPTVRYASMTSARRSSLTSTTNPTCGQNIAFNVRSCEYSLRTHRDFPFVYAFTRKNSHLQTTQDNIRPTPQQTPYPTQPHPTQPNPTSTPRSSATSHPTHIPLR